MTTQPIPVTNAPLPAAASSKLQNIENIILAALAGLQLVPGTTGATASLLGVFAGILVNAQAAYAAESGQPIDLTKIPLETPVT